MDPGAVPAAPEPLLVLEPPFSPEAVEERVALLRDIIGLDRGRPRLLDRGEPEDPDEGRVAVQKPAVGGADELPGDVVVDERRYFASLSFRASATCFCAVMSCTIGSSNITRPAASRTYRTERWPQTMAPLLADEPLVELCTGLSRRRRVRWPAARPRPRRRDE